MNTDNPESHIIIQTLSTDGENNADINDNGNNEREVDNTEENHSSYSTQKKIHRQHAAGDPSRKVYTPST